jgi:predicted RNase H-like HicB family nuclease
MARYAILLTPDLESGGYTVTVPALPGCITHGDTVEEALEMARDAIACYLELPDGVQGLDDDRIEAIMVTVDVAAPA